MKVECTRREQELLTAVLESPEYCLFEGQPCYGAGHCDKCARERIEWIITDVTVEDTTGRG